MCVTTVIVWYPLSAAKMWITTQQHCAWICFLIQQCYQHFFVLVTLIQDHHSMYHSHWSSWLRHFIVLAASSLLEDRLWLCIRVFPRTQNQVEVIPHSFKTIYTCIYICICPTDNLSPPLAGVPGCKDEAFLCVVFAVPWRKLWFPWTICMCETSYVHKSDTDKKHVL